MPPPGIIEIGDVTGDGTADVVCADYDGWSVRILAGNGDLTLQSTVAAVVSTLETGIALADVDGDGDLDVTQPVRYTDGIVTTLTEALLCSRGCSPMPSSAFPTAWP